MWSHDFSANNPPVQALAAALTQPYLWPSAVLLLAAACVAATLQSWPSIIYTRLRTCAHTYAHRACAAYSIPCPGATPDFKLQLAEPEGQVNLQGSSAEVTQTGNNCLSHFFFSFFFCSVCVCNFACNGGNLHTAAPCCVCANVDGAGRFSPGLAAGFFEYFPPAAQTPLSLACFSGSGFQSAVLSVPVSPRVFRLGFTG